jgi:LacI family transcriptional regulator
VSRVLNNSPKVSPEAKSSVLRSMKELNYRPNSLARSLKLEKTSTIAYLVSNISNLFFTQIMQGLEDILQEHEYTLLVGSIGNDAKKEVAYLKTFLEKKVDGIVLNTTGLNDAFVASVSHEVPIVLSNRSIFADDFIGDLVDNNNADDACALTRHLVELGHRDIGVINGDLALSTGRERMDGFVKGMRAAGISIGEAYPFRYDGRFRFEDGYKGMETLMNRGKRPTALVIMNNEMTLGVLEYCKQHNISIQEDISIVSFGDIANSRLLYVQPTLVSHNYRALGNKLAELVVERINSKSIHNNREFRYSSTLVQGNSTRRMR